MNDFLNTDFNKYERIQFHICQERGTHLRIMTFKETNSLEEIKYIVTGLRIKDGTLDVLHTPKNLKECNDIIFYCIENNIQYKNYTETK